MDQQLPMHRRRSCASQHKLGSRLASIKTGGRCEILERWSCQYEYQRQVTPVITHTTARVGKHSSRRRLDSPATCHSSREWVEQSKRSPVVVCADTNQNWHGKIDRLPKTSQMEGTETNLGVTWELAVDSTFAVWKEQIIERSKFATLRNLI